MSLEKVKGRENNKKHTKQWGKYMYINVKCKLYFITMLCYCDPNYGNISFDTNTKTN